MSYKVVITTSLALMLSASTSWAQSERPAETLQTDRPRPDTSAGTVNGPSSRGAGTGEHKPTATGGEPGGGTNQQ